jgi:hypothetical protein
MHDNLTAKLGVNPGRKAVSRLISALQQISTVAFTLT